MFLRMALAACGPRSFVFVVLHNGAAVWNAVEYQVKHYGHILGKTISMRYGGLAKGKGGRWDCGLLFITTGIFARWLVQYGPIEVLRNVTSLIYDEAHEIVKPLANVVISAIRSYTYTCVCTSVTRVIACIRLFA